MHSADSEQLATIGEAVRLLRDIGELTQTETANKVKVKRDAIAKWEAGIHLPKPENFSALADLAAQIHLELRRRGKKQQAEQAVRLAAFFREARDESESSQGKAGHTIARAFIEVLDRARRGDPDARRRIDLLSKTEADLNSFMESEFSKIQQVSDSEQKKQATSRLLDEVHGLRTLRDGLFYFIGRSRAVLERDLARFSGWHPDNLLEIERLVASRFLDHQSEVVDRQPEPPLSLDLSLRRKWKQKS